MLLTYFFFKFHAKFEPNIMQICPKQHFSAPLQKIGTNVKMNNISCANSQYFDSVIYCLFRIIYRGTRQCLTEQQAIIYGILLKIFLRV